MAELRRFFTDRQNLRIGSSVLLSEDEGRHIRQALRLNTGDNIKLFNGQQEFVARLTTVSSEAVMAEIFEESVPDKLPEKQISIFQGLIRLPQMELVIQKATELGVDNIIPVETEFSQTQINNPEKRYVRWDKIIKEACKQSERVTIPSLYDPVSLIEAFALLPELMVDMPILFTTPREMIQKIAKLSTLSEMAPDVANAKHVGIFIGPEGGFSPLEHKSASQNDVPFAYFHDNILRAETAGISAVALIDYIQKA